MIDAIYATSWAQDNKILQILYVFAYVLLCFVAMGLFIDTDYNNYDLHDLETIRLGVYSCYQKVSRLSM